MTKPIPIIAAVAAVIVLILAGLAVGPWVRLSRIKQDLLVKEQVIASLKTENESFQQQLTELSTQRAELETRLTTLQHQLTNAIQELAALRDVQVRYDAVQSEKVRLDVEVARLNRERKEVDERVRRMEAEKRELEQTSARLRNRLMLAERDYKQLSERFVQMERQLMQYPPVTSTGIQPPRIEAAWPPVIANVIVPSAAVVSPSWASAGEPEAHLGLQTGAPVASPGSSAAATPSDALHVSMSQRAAALSTPQAIELPPIVVRRGQVSMAASPLIRARILEINPAHRFVVIDQGTDQGVREGMTFEIIRDSRRLGQAVVVRARPRLSACDLSQVDAPGAIQVGDLAVQRN